MGLKVGLVPSRDLDGPVVTDVEGVLYIAKWSSEIDISQMSQRSQNAELQCQDYLKIIQVIGSLAFNGEAGWKWRQMRKNFGF